MLLPAKKIINEEKIKMKFIVKPKQICAAAGCGHDCNGNCALKCGKLGNCFCPLDGIGAR